MLGPKGQLLSGASSPSPSKVRKSKVKHYLSQHYAGSTLSLQRHFPTLQRGFTCLTLAPLGKQRAEPSYVGLLSLLGLVVEALSLEPSQGAGVLIHCKPTALDVQGLNRVPSGNCLSIRCLSSCPGVQQWESCVDRKGLFKISG